MCLPFSKTCDFVSVSSFFLSMTFLLILHCFKSSGLSHIHFQICFRLYDSILNKWTKFYEYHITKFKIIHCAIMTEERNMIN